MSDAIVNLLIQVPLVGAFIIYSLYAQRSYLEALSKKEAAFEKRNAAVIEAIQDMNKSICAKIDRSKR
jgi:hypothetical protein